LPFARIIPLVERILSDHNAVAQPSITDIEDVDRWARTRAAELTPTLASRVITT
jgi:hypothetical protein